METDLERNSLELREMDHETNRQESKEKRSES